MILERGQRVDFDDDESFAFVVVVPLTATFLYFLAVFSFGLSGDLAARQSMYPARMFTLPVTTAALAGWPMLYGARGDGDALARRRGFSRCGRPASTCR